MTSSSAEPGAGARLRQFLGLPADERRQLLRAAFWLPVMHFALKRAGLKPCLRWIGAGRGRAAPAAAGARLEQALGCRRSVALAARHGLVAGTCLSRSLTVMLLLARRRIPGRLRLGVDLGGGAFKAHAWVEVAGIPLDDPGEAGRAPFPGFDTDFGPPPR
jgi:hypothetical protein